MASVPSSTWAFSPNCINSSPSFPKSLLFPARRREFLRPIHSSPSEEAPEGQSSEPPDPMKLAFAKAEAYKKEKKKSTPIPEQNPVPKSTCGASGSGDPDSEVPEAVKLAFEKVKEYRKKKGAVGGDGNAAVEKPRDSGQEMMNSRNLKEFEQNKVSKKEEIKVSGIDFLGLDFSEKKRYRGVPPGLAPVVEPLLEGDLPEVEIIVGDPSKFENTTPSTSVGSTEADDSTGRYKPKVSTSSASTTMNSKEDDDSMGLYKPKVSTWGVFPRPSNISKTFGGGRVIRPGEVLETAEDKIAKEKRSRELLAAYKNRMGLTLDAKTNFECKEALKEGDNLMNLGKLEEALPYYEKIMKKLVFQSELHGMAALQWSICQDSLRRPDKARIMYEKLQSHPNVQVSKKARQFMFSFQPYFRDKCQDRAHFLLHSLIGHDASWMAQLPLDESLSSPEHCTNP
ncbi:uncharacterized protein LOC103705594 isoform X2 [Phoenix dactylifera]|uniref:Uncharacterized protein LOC103705594 isoform X2 n=1 Tax=Phoenix dactylifera TaxID=42345 RepID=A0A8B8J426_PHODC|nr:uncharacterized protein LOC103705594 isoform X2 [Phoenix dactylifera]